MECRKAHSLLSGHHGGELQINERVALEVHLESCPQCAAKLAELRRLSQLASNLNKPEPSQHLRDRVLQLPPSRQLAVRWSMRKKLSLLALLPSSPAWEPFF